MKHLDITTKRFGKIIQVSYKGSFIGNYMDTEPMSIIVEDIYTWIGIKVMDAFDSNLIAGKMMKRG